MCVCVCVHVRVCMCVFKRATEKNPPHRDFMELWQPATIAACRVHGFIPLVKSQAFPPLQTSFIHSCHAPFSLVVQHPNLFVFIAVIHWIIPDCSRSTHSMTSHSFANIHRFSHPILPVWPNHRRTLSSVLWCTPFFTPPESLTHAFGSLSMLLIPKKPLS